jgi:hypothetical protein
VGNSAMDAHTFLRVTKAFSVDLDAPSLPGLTRQSISLN